MAGIGFRLQLLLNRGSYGSLVQAYVYSALVATGPWLLSILGLTAIGVLVRPMLPPNDVALFRCVVVYAYAASLVLTGAIQMGTTRYLADRLFVGDTKALVPCYHWVGVVVLAGGGLVAAVLYGVAGLDLSGTVGATVMFQAICLTWIGMIFLSAAKDYLAITRAFALGYGIAIAGAMLGARLHGVDGMIWGFAAGQAILAGMIGIRIRVEFPSDHAADSRTVRHWRTMPALAVIGLFYNLGTWIDKLVFWCSPEAMVLVGGFRVCPRYDTCIFLAYLTVVPALALFLIRIEVAFYKSYAAFYAAVTRGADLATLRREKQAMVSALRLSATRLFKLQGAITFGLILVAPQLVELLGLPLDHVPLLRVALIGAFLQVLLQIVLVILLYFDWQREVAWMTVIFTALNGALTWWSLQLGEQYHGFGYVIACLISLVYALMVLEHRSGDLEYETFVKQPIRS